ncbi:MAG: sigma-70 family RNA polymerase sigma factor [Planctomycetota bacterium]|jgi:RNA polymerase sigma factor (sigma-70 family)|nr:sigma-70 family RNA polymerase sigma factor [Planctomycetota bacterium]MDP6761639.1 sigma-70 family RNA polymerase sigma factor [Planctomycetota bacterium]MDP6990456.1 sigma-70 family RNA polymerase sigma factor [Planctomycetota bacterium]
MDTSHPLFELAARHLGQATARVLANQGCARAFERALEEGTDELDALLAIAYPVAREDRAVAGEFLQHFMALLLSTPDAVPGHDLRHIVDPQDLVQSVVGDLLPLLCELEFHSRGQFASLLVQRLHWKRVDKIRRQKTTVRGGDRKRKSIDPDARATRQHRANPLTPLSAMICAEEEERLVLAMHELDEEDQKILRAGMSGVSASELAEQLGCSAEAARKRAERARNRLRERLRIRGGTGNGEAGGGG